MESFDLYAFTSSLSYFHIAVLLVVALLASIISGISGYGGGMTLGILVSPFIPIKLLVPLMSVFVFCSNASRMYYYRDSIFWKKGLYFAIIGTPFIILGTNFYAGVSDKVLYFCLGFGLVDSHHPLHVLRLVDGTSHLVHEHPLDVGRCIALLLGQQLTFSHA